MLPKYNGDLGMIFKFVIATNANLSADKERVAKFFKTALKKSKVPASLFKLEIWDDEELSKIETKLGLALARESSEAV